MTLGYDNRRWGGVYRGGGYATTVYYFISKRAVFTSTARLRSLPTYTVTVKLLLSKIMNSNTQSKGNTENHPFSLEKPIFYLFIHSEIEIQPDLCKHVFQELHQRIHLFLGGFIQVD